MTPFTGDLNLLADFDGEALVIRDENRFAAGVVIVEAEDVIDFLGFLQGVVAGANA